MTGGGAGRVRRTDAARNAQRLLAAAGELFAERGPEVPLDEVARRAGVGNATLYRHFPTRGDLVVAVYADEVAALCRRGAELAGSAAAGAALDTWLGEFVDHITGKRPLAAAVTERPDERRSRLFEQWHAEITAVAARLIERAQAAGAARPDLAPRDLLALLGAAALAARDAAHARQLLGLVRDGFARDRSISVSTQPSKSAATGADPPA